MKICGRILITVLHAQAIGECPPFSFSCLQPALSLTHGVALQTRLLRLLCVERLAALDAPARAAVLNGMQAGGVFRLMGDEGMAP
jgi:hypothetical protein